jgi:hypothetical protein
MHEIACRFGEKRAVKIKKICFRPKKLVFGRFNSKVMGFSPENEDLHPLTRLYTFAVLRVLSDTEFHMAFLFQNAESPERESGGPNARGVDRRLQRSEQSWGEFRGTACYAGKRIGQLSLPEPDS